MHTTFLQRGWLAIHNGDFSGDITFKPPDYAGKDHKEDVEIPFDLIKALVAQWVINEKISRLEDHGAEDADMVLLGWRT